MPKKKTPKPKLVFSREGPSHIRDLGIVLAGGKGSRLFPLTRERAKPAVPFGGKYRIVDFVLSNFINSGINSIYVLTQFRSQSLLQHLSQGWQFSGLLKSYFIIPVPAQMRSEDETWYQGTADAILQNINLVQQSDTDVVAIFGGDHIYRMNIASMIDFHMATDEAVQQLGLPAHTKGVVVTDINPFSPVADSGLRQGDVIQEVNHQAVTNVTDFDQAVQFVCCGA